MFGAESDMAKKGTDYDKLNEQLTFEDDGLPISDVGAWTRNKLALIAYYLPEFARLCSEKARGWYFIDGFAGCGANRSPGFPPAKGSALLGVTQTPFARHSLLCELSPANVRVLTARCAPFADRVTILPGDANLLLPGGLELLDDRHVPGFCVLDPYGLELDWVTVELCSAHRQVGSPYELLIYFATPGAARSAGVQDATYAAANASRLTRTFGGEAWRETAERQQAGKLRPGEAGRLYLDLYKKQLRQLGYTAVLERPAIRDDGNLIYHLVFASANDAGESIMTYALKRAYATQLPLQL